MRDASSIIGENRVDIGYRTYGVLNACVYVLYEWIYLLWIVGNHTYNGMQITCNKQYLKFCRKSNISFPVLQI